MIKFFKKGTINLRFSAPIFAVKDFCCQTVNRNHLLLCPICTAEVKDATTAVVLQREDVDTATLS